MTETVVVSVIGAGGAMTTSFLRGLAISNVRALRLRLYDLNPVAAQRSAALFPEGVATAHALDLFAPDALAAAVTGATYVVNDAGPFYRTASIVRRAPLQTDAHAMNIDDDVESTLDALALDLDARAKGLALFVGCGASPGLTNVLARDLVEAILSKTRPLDVTCLSITTMERASEHQVFLAQGLISHRTLGIFAR